MKRLVEENTNQCKKHLFQNTHSLQLIEYAMVLNVCVPLKFVC